MTRNPQGLGLVARPGSARRGFTLIELLVVVAVIAILAGILFPVFNQARAKAKQASCQSNVKQLGTAFQLYIQDYDETFPPVYIDPSSRDIPDSTQVDNPAWRGFSWTERVFPYVKNEVVFKCPTDTAPVQRAPVNARFVNSFAYNPLFGTAPDPNSPSRLMTGALTQAQLTNSAEVAMLWDTPVDPTTSSGPLSKNNLSRTIPDRRQAPFYLYMADTTMKALEAEEGTFTVAKEASVNWKKPRHANTSTVLFADSHVKAIQDPSVGARNAAEVTEKLNRFFDPRYAVK